LAHRFCLAGTAAVMIVLGAFAWVPLRNLDAGGVLVAVAGGFVLAAVPYVCMGAALALSLRQARVRGRLYAADLAGAATACLAGLALMQVGGPPAAAWVAALALFFAAGCFARLRWLGLAAGGAALACAAAAALGAYGPNVLPTKPLAIYLDPVLHPDSGIVLTRWDAVSRVDVFRAPGTQLLWSASFDQGQLQQELLGITIDGDALTAVVRLDDRDAQSDVGATDALPASLPFQMAPRERVLVIGPGGGVDVVAALRYGARHVDAVEVNSAVAQVMLGPLEDFSGQLYRRPGVHLVQDEGRSYLRRTTERYDAIVLTAVDSWAALTAGAYSLAESYLYTREAMADYYDHLADGGTLAISRWFTRPPQEMERLAALAAQALASRGQTAAHAVLLQRADDFGTLLVRRGDFPLAEVERARRAAPSEGAALAYDPLAPSGTFAPILAGTVSASATALPSDDRPYFFDFQTWSAVLAGRTGAGGLPRGHAVLLLTLIEGACMAAASIVLPLRRLDVKLPRRTRGPWAVYFSLIGVGFMAAEMALLPRFLLLLGYPAVALGVTLGALLAGGAAGSWLASSGLVARHAAVPLAVTAVLLLLYAGGLPPLLAGALRWSLAGRLGLSLALLLPLGAAMGAALPLGLTALAGGAAVPWAWGINGAASAVGASIATMAAMEWGLSAVLLGAAGCYAAAALVRRVLRRPVGGVDARLAQMR
jgi:spermidine synthase